MSDGPYIEHGVLVDELGAWVLHVFDVNADLRGRAASSTALDEEQKARVGAMFEAFERAAEARRRRMRGSASGTAEQVDDGDMAPSELVTTPQAAEETGVSDSYIRRLARDGRLFSARKVAGRWQVDPGEVAEMIREES